MARAESPSLSCTPEGDFEPLQCDALQCQCVEPSDGTPVPGTQVTVDDPSNLPDCDEEGKELNLDFYLNTLHLCTHLYNWITQKQNHS